MNALQDLSLSLSVMSWVASLCLALAYVITLWLLPDIKVNKFVDIKWTSRLKYRNRKLDRWRNILGYYLMEAGMSSLHHLLQ